MQRTYLNPTRKHTIVNDFVQTSSTGHKTTSIVFYNHERN